MRILLDTNVISEPQKPLPSAAVERFLRDTPEEGLFLSIITIAELYRGVALMTEGRRRTRLSEWVAAELPERFGDRLLPITTSIAALWGDVMAQSRRNGLNISIMDGFLAATAAAHSLAIATRNVRHFTGLGVTVIDPWAEI
ncbi:VapC toxin family PIN domain ribonuclease [Bosea sp. Tri-44]|uniref:type II toxin-antitoxin system VapC family toxin n=1 Tax=Bosea sp. Tri-44 TaxID=1972137 RepID=UPI00100F6C83|nr:type II toxin-antitoxin system VapC family toxin [Bosea sp. Tri-44]RXT53061.1 VapC toxin family PIN domain ribonuclease [Bosea sp. Tri-44]